MSGPLSAAGGHEGTPRQEDRRVTVVSLRAISPGDQGSTAATHEHIDGQVSARDGQNRRFPS